MKKGVYYEAWPRNVDALTTWNCVNIDGELLSQVILIIHLDHRYAETDLLPRNAVLTYDLLPPLFFCLFLFSRFSFR